MAEIEFEGRKLNMVKGVGSRIKLITHHIPTGKLVEPYWAVSIEGSPYLGIKDIVKSGEVAKKLHEEREGKK